MIPNTIIIKRHTGKPRILKEPGKLSQFRFQVQQI